MGTDSNNLGRLNYQKLVHLGIVVAGAIAVMICLMIFMPEFTVYGFRGPSAAPNKDENLILEPSRPATVRQQVAQDLSIQKSHSGNFLIGQTGTYLITVRNVGTGTVGGQVTVTDILPPGLVPISSTGGGWTPCGFTGQTVVCTHPNTSGLAVGESLPTITIVVNVMQAAAPSVTNAATLTNASDGNFANNTASDPTVIVSADLAATKSVLPTNPSELTDITYTLTIRNNGPSDTTNVVLTDTLPSGLTFLSAIATRGSYNLTTGAWTVGNIANGETVTLNINALVNANTRGQTIVNATNGLRSDLYDYQSSNNQPSASFRVRSTRLIGIVSQLGSGQPVVSASLVFTDSLSHVYTTTTSASGWYTFTETIDRPMAAGNYSVRASRAGYNPTTIFSTLTADIDNRQDIILTTSDLAVAKTNQLTTVIPGQTITYTLAITNVGSVAASQIVITDTLPSYLTYITDTLRIPHTTPVAGTIVWRPTTVLAPNTSIRFSLRTLVAAALPNPTTSIVNTLTARSGSPEANLANNTATHTLTSTGSPNITVTKSVFPTQVYTAQSATYTIVVNNTGTAPATSVTVTDQFSTFVDILSVTTTKGTSTTNTSTRRVSVDIGTMNPNEVVTITVIVRVNSTATFNTTVPNTASVSYVFGGTTSSRTSNSVSFQLYVTGTLPVTGGVELDHLGLNYRGVPYFPAVLSALLLGLLGLIAIIYGIAMRRRGSDWAGWAMKMGVLFTVVAIAFGLLAFWMQGLSLDENIALLSRDNSSLANIDKQALSMEMEEDSIEMPPSQMDDLPSLPDFPVPTPTLSQLSADDGASLDTSDVTRIVVPAINLDTVVKYVPFDGLTWLIAGLKQEIAWMGNTSWPGLGSNTGLAGHVTLRTGEEGPFRYLDDLQQDDIIMLYTENNLYTYKVREKKTVEETDLSVVDATEKPQLTLITCTGWDNRIRYYVKRLAVIADLEKVEPLEVEEKGN
jgi:LPXTG-site transpeptidase (sortase) family protein